MHNTVKETREALLRLRLGFALLLVTFICGSVGFYFIEDSVHTPLDAVYYTLVTISTVGYGDIAPETAAGKILSIFIIFFGVGSVLVTIPMFFELIVRKEIKEVLKLPGDECKFKNHIIVCGWGKVGKSIVDDLSEGAIDFTIIENDIERIKHMVDRGFSVIQGDACSDSALKNAGIDNAQMLIATLDDVANVFIVLTAKVLNPNIKVICKVDYVKNDAKLKRAGADQIINCHDIGAKEIIRIVTQEEVRS